MIQPVTNAQRQFLDGDAKIRGFVGPTATGKTQAALALIYQLAMPGRSYLILDHELVRIRNDGFRRFEAMGVELGRLVQVARGRLEATIKAGDGVATVCFGSFDALDRHRGLKFAGCVIDNAQWCADSTYRAIRLILTHDAWLVVCKEPHWTERVLFGPAASERGVAVAWDIGQSNPYLSQSEYVRMREAYSSKSHERFVQEYQQQWEPASHDKRSSDGSGGGVCGESRGGQGPDADRQEHSPGS